MGVEPDYFETVFPLSEKSGSVVCPVRFWSRCQATRVAVRLFRAAAARPERTAAGLERTAARPERTAARSVIYSVTPDVLTYSDLDERITSIQNELRKEERQKAGPDFEFLTGLVAEPTADTVATLFACFREKIPVVLHGTRTPSGETARSLIALDSSRRLRREIGALSDRLDLDGVATAVFTSGSSGRPKLAAHSIRNHFESAKAACLHVPLLTSDSWLLSLDLSHVGGLGILFRSLLSGASVSIVETGWSANCVRLPGVTHVSLVAAQLRHVLDLPHDGFTGERQLLVGGGPIPADLIRKAVRSGYLVRTTYGLTELSSQVSTSPCWEKAQKRYSAGSLLGHCEARVRGDGVLLLRSKSVFLGYLENGNLVASVDSEGWFCTNDLVSIDEGELYVRGRSDSMFISGGENIHPQEIEEVLLSLTGVKRAVVVPVPDTEYGSRPVAFIAVDDGQITIKRVRIELSSRLPGFKIPDHFFDFPADSSLHPGSTDREEFQRLASELVSG